MLHINKTLENIVPKVHYFDNDDEFYNFCVIPQLVVKKVLNNDNQEICYTDFNFSDAYNDEIANNTFFVIKDKNSQIIKHNNVVSYRTIGKKVQNLKPWYYEKIFECDK